MATMPTPTKPESAAPTADPKTTETRRLPDMPFRDQVWRINFEDGRKPAYVAVYNDEITAWSDNAPDGIKAYSAWFSARMSLLSATGMAFHYEGINE